MRFKPKKENAFGLNPWMLVDDDFSMVRQELNHKEMVFAQGNGFIGMRGSYDEPVSENEWDSCNACFLNGSYEVEDILYTFRRKGMNPTCEVMLRVPDWHMINVAVDDEVFCMPDVEILSTERVFNIRNGVVTRKVVWKTKLGKTVTIHSKRFICLTRKNSCVVEYSVEVDCDAHVAVSTEFEGDVKNLFSKEKFLSVDSLMAEANVQNLELVTERSGQRVVMASLLQVNGSAKGIEGSFGDTKTVSAYKATVKANERVDVSKFVNIALTAKDNERVGNKLVSDVLKDLEDGIEILEKEQNEYWDAFWENADITIDGDAAVQQGIRFCMMQLVQNSGKDGRTNIGAKGLTGYSYAGKCFWDTEIYMQPMLLNAQPELARNLIDFRYHTLDKARALAKFSYMKGALYPWETISGEESSFIYEAATAQFHLQCAIGFSIKQYLAATDDVAYIADKGLEVLLETSRCLFDVGAFIPARDNKFCMNCVCGPDEYSPMVDNNCYTNTMTMHHFDFTLQMVKKIADFAPEKLDALKIRINLREEELASFAKARDNMYIPYSDEYQIHLQDDQFLYKDPVDLEAWMKTDEYVKHDIHSLSLFRKQLLKQADVVLLMVLRSKDYSVEQQKMNYEFYEPKTINDSSLSPCAYSIVASVIGKDEHFFPYLKYTSRMDIDNYQGAGGLHTASMGGAWMSVVQGVAGIVVQDGLLYIDPKLTKDWCRLEFKYRFKNSQVNIKITTDEFEITLLKGDGFGFKFKNEDYQLSPDNDQLRIKHSLS